MLLYSSLTEHVGALVWLRSQAPGCPALLAVALSPNAVGIYNEEVCNPKLFRVRCKLVFQAGRDGKS